MLRVLGDSANAAAVQISKTEMEASVLIGKPIFAPDGVAKTCGSDYKTMIRRGATMDADRYNLSAKTVAVLEMIAAGSSYEQILSAYPDLTYLDIFRAASEVLDAMVQPRGSQSYQVEDIRKSYPRAYEKSSLDEERRLAGLIDQGLTVAQIAHRLQRQRSAIRSRITRLNLIGRLNEKEQQELHRISKLDAIPADPSEDQ